MNTETTNEPIELRGTVGADFDHLDALFKLSGPGPHQIALASNGGASEIGTAIAAHVRKHDVRIDCHFAESAAVAILLAGKHRTIAADGWLFLHRAWSVATGNAADLRATIEHLDRLDGHYAKVVAAGTRLTPDEVLALMAKDSRLTPDQALEHGFVHEIVEPVGLEPPKSQTDEKYKVAEEMHLLGLQMTQCAPPGSSEATKRAAGLANHAVHVASESDPGFAEVERQRRGLRIDRARAVTIWNGYFSHLYGRLQKLKAGLSPKPETWAGRWICPTCRGSNFSPPGAPENPTPCFRNCEVPS